MSLHPKRIDGIQICRLAGGTVSEQYPDATGNHERNYHCHPGNTERNDALSQASDQPDESKCSHHSDQRPQQS